MELERRATQDLSLLPGHQGGGEVVFETDLGQLVPARWTDWDVRHGLSLVISSRFLHARISSRTVLYTSRRSSSPPAARKGSRNDQCRRCSAPGKTGRRRWPCRRR